MESSQAVTMPPAPFTLVPSANLPDHTQLPESDGTFVKNFQEHPQSLVLTSSIVPILQKLHPDGKYCIGQDSGIYWRLTDPPEKGAEAPDWFYVGHVAPLVNGEFRRSYVMWKESIAPLIAIEFVSGNGLEERDNSPPSETQKAGKFWVYEQAIRIPFYAIYEVRKASVEVYRLNEGRYENIQPNDRGHYPIAAMGVELGIKEDESTPWLRWWDGDGNLLLTGDERAETEMQGRLKAESIAAKANLAQQQAEKGRQRAETIAEQERQQKEKLAAYLRSIGLDPDQIY